MSEIMLMLDWLVLLIWGASASITTMEKGLISMFTLDGELLKEMKI